jgi:hypothetical protein
LINGNVLRRPDTVVSDYYVDSSKLRHRCVHQISSRFRSREVLLHSNTARCAAALVDKLVGLLRRSLIIEQDARAGFSEHPHRSGAYAAGTAGYNRDAALQRHSNSAFMHQDYDTKQRQVFATVDARRLALTWTGFGLFRLLRRSRKVMIGLHFRRCLQQSKSRLRTAVAAGRKLLTFHGEDLMRCPVLMVRRCVDAGYRHTVAWSE